MSHGKKTYEVWRSEDDSILCSTAESVVRLRESGMLDEGAALLHRFEAATYEAAMSIHYAQMGWEPYKPMGESTPCPNACGAEYYPEGSGECPNCGEIG